ncbi:hypothetical protein ACHHYP_20697 [Achlya hypogyna]|uniref:Uncharacterized protein n=1 Tax=Achlya hypogyna TaxID=1202772 RepID=A0A1V9YEI3_ACHHY|nr:hypothetical protein ACHHYP_20697 [Achlya hypogyna]
MKLPGGRLRRALGVAYICACVGGSVWFLAIASPYLVNDLFWPAFAPRGAQTSLLDVFRLHLLGAAGGTIGIFDAASAIPRPTATKLKMQPTYHRQLLLSELKSLEIRPCWVDLAKRWELAHTLGRQLRCSAKEAANGAVFLKPVLRNVQWDLFMTYQDST